MIAAHDAECLPSGHCACMSSCLHGEVEGHCAACAACVACRGNCDICPYSQDYRR